MWYEECLCGPNFGLLERDLKRGNITNSNQISHIRSVFNQPSPTPYISSPLHFSHFRVMGSLFSCCSDVLKLPRYNTLNSFLLQTPDPYMEVKKLEKEGENQPLLGEHSHREASLPPSISRQLSNILHSPKIVLTGEEAANSFMPRRQFSKRELLMIADTPPKLDLREDFFPIVLSKGNSLDKNVRFIQALFRGCLSREYFYRISREDIYFLFYSFLILVRGQLVVSEIIVTEESYIRKLKLIIKCYIRPLLLLAKQGKIKIREKEVNKVFNVAYTIQVIATFHEEGFLPSIQDKGKKAHLFYTDLCLSFLELVFFFPPNHFLQSPNNIV